MDEDRFEPRLWERLVAANLAPADLPAEEFPGLDQEMTTREEQYSKTVKNTRGGVIIHDGHFASAANNCGYTLVITQPIICLFQNL